MHAQVRILVVLDFLSTVKTCPVLWIIMTQITRLVGDPSFRNFLIQPFAWLALQSKLIAANKYADVSAISAETWTQRIYLCVKEVLLQNV